VIQDFRHDALTTFHGLPIFPFSVGDAADLEPAGIPEDVEAWAWRVSCEGMDSVASVPGERIWALFVASVDTTRVKALALGGWDPEESMGAGTTSATRSWPTRAASRTWRRCSSATSPPR
jgi:hypothetical protein